MPIPPSANHRNKRPRARSNPSGQSEESKASDGTIRAASNPNLLPLSFEPPPARAGGMIVRSTEPASPTRESDRPAKGPPHGQRGFCRRPVKAKAAKPLSKPRRTSNPRRGGWRTTRFTSGQLLLSANRKIPEDLLVELQEFVAMTLSHARSMMKILLVHFNMKYNGKSIILCITRVDLHISPTSYPHNYS